MAAPSAELAHNAVELPAAILDELGVRAGDLVRLRGKRRTTVAVVVAVKRCDIFFIRFSLSLSLFRFVLTPSTHLNGKCSPYMHEQKK